MSRRACGPRRTAGTMIHNNVIGELDIGQDRARCRSAVVTTVGGKRVKASWASDGLVVKEGRETVV